MPYNVQRGAPWRGKMPIGRPSAPQPRYPPNHGHMTDQGYIDRDGYAMQHMELWDMYEEGDPHGYRRPPIRYGSNQPGIGSAPPLLHITPNIQQAYPQALTGPVRARAHGKDRPPASPPDFVEDVYSFECPESSRTLSIPDPHIPGLARKTGSVAQEKTPQSATFLWSRRGRKDCTGEKTIQNCVQQRGKPK